jgi:hypothetical protein
LTRCIYRNSLVGDVSGATRRDRTGDLLITNFRLYPYAIDSLVGMPPFPLAYSA